MGGESSYMLGVVAAGFIVNFTLRAVPFILLGKGHAEPPRWVVKFGNLISPVIITGLIVYSFSGLEWKSAYPYLAGLLTVGLQIWRRNPLLSIIAGTLAYIGFMHL